MGKNQLDKLTNLLLSDVEANEILAFNLIKEFNLSFNLLANKIKAKVQALYYDTGNDTTFRITILKKRIRVYKANAFNGNASVFRQTKDGTFISFYHNLKRSGILKCIDVFIQEIEKEYHNTILQDDALVS